MNSLSLTIVIPVFNEENYLENCLESIAQQEVMPDEVVVINNNSTDASQQIAKKYYFVSLINEQKQGIVHARNSGFNYATSDIIARIDADTVLPSNWVKEAKIRASVSDESVAYTGPCEFYDHKHKKFLFGFHRIIYFWLSRVAFGHNILFGSNMIINKNYWDKIKLETCINNSIHEDMDLASHVVKAGGYVVFDENFRASISSRRFSNWKYYPSKWVRTWSAHGLIPKFYQSVRDVYEGGEY